MMSCFESFKSMLVGTDDSIKMLNKIESTLAKITDRIKTCDERSYRIKNDFLLLQREDTGHPALTQLKCELTKILKQRKYMGDIQTLLYDMKFSLSNSIETNEIMSDFNQISSNTKNGVDIDSIATTVATNADMQREFENVSMLLSEGVSSNQSSDIDSQRMLDEFLGNKRIAPPVVAVPSTTKAAVSEQRNAIMI